MTLLCVPIFVDSVDQARRDIALAGEAGADIVELRLDGFEGDASDLVDHSILPTIITDRAPNEGGHSEEIDEQRLERLTFLAHLADHTDVELETLRRTGAKRAEFGSSLIVSYHDFKNRPDRLYNVIADIAARDADVHKVVWMARSIRDNLEAFELLQTRQKPTIALCMGEAGLISRVLAKSLARSSPSPRCATRAPRRRAKSRSAT